MNRPYIALALATLLLVGAAHAEPQGTPAEPGRLTPFASQKELSSTLEQLIENAGDCRGTAEITSMGIRKRRPVLSPSRLDDAREAVQEGGIVKRHGDYLVILHRRRLFTVAIGNGALRPVAGIDAVGVDTGPGPTEYQELLLLGDHAVLIGDSAESGVEIASFRIDRSGALTREGTWHLRPFSLFCLTPSHASYVIGDKLVIYSWHPLDVADDASFVLPGLHRWSEDEDSDDEDDEKDPYAPTAGPRDIYRKRLRDGKVEGDMLHTLTQCDLAARVLKCSSTVVLGGAMREFHASATALYIWSEGRDDLLGGPAPQGVLYRMPYDGSPPGRVPVSGKPSDRFSFRSDAKNLEVLLTASEQPDDTDALPMALLRLPISDIARGRTLPSARYLALPAAKGYFGANRFLGEHVLYSSTQFDDDRARSHVVAARVSDGGATELDVQRRITSIEATTSGALALGDPGDPDKGFSIAKLDAAPRAALTAQFVTSDFSQARVLDGFQYDRASATIAVPVLAHDAQKGEHLPAQVSMAFFANEGTATKQIGSIASHEQDVSDDACDVLGCEKWFENARALFLGDRIFVLLGYELIEAKRTGDQIVETQRAHFAPAAIFSPARTTEPSR